MWKRAYIWVPSPSFPLMAVAGTNGVTMLCSMFCEKGIMECIQHALADPDDNAKTSLGGKTKMFRMLSRKSYCRRFPLPGCSLGGILRANVNTSTIPIVQYYLWKGLIEDFHYRPTFCWQCNKLMLWVPVPSGYYYLHITIYILSNWVLLLLRAVLINNIMGWIVQLSVRLPFW